MDNKNVSEYFDVNAEAWLIDAYEQSGYNYPTPQHRLRVVTDILHRVDNIKRLLDLGCGGGTLAIALANGGINVHGIDQSDKMIKHAQMELKKQSAEVRRRVTFDQKPLEEVETDSYDALTAMGVIGYLANDALLFELASRVLRKKGYMIISFRNRLFNLYSISHRTIREITENQFTTLSDEASELYQKIDKNKVLHFLKELHKVSGQLLKDGALDIEAIESPSMRKGKQYASEIEARQTTPRQAIKTAMQYGFQTLQLYGVHPHFSVPGLNTLLPPQVYNRLSDSLIPLETTPASLLWSSVFIGVFQKI